MHDGKPSIIERAGATAFCFGDPEAAEAAAEAFENIEEAVADGRLLLIRDYPVRARKAYRLTLENGKYLFVKVDDLAYRTRLDRRLLSRHPFMAEAYSMAEANRRGILTPKVIAVGASPRSVFRKMAFMATTWTEGYDRLDYTLQTRRREEPELVPKILKSDVPRALARLFASMHEKGFVHHDIQGSHMFWRMVDNEIEWLFVDLEGARFMKPLPLRYRIKTLYMAGRHILSGFEPPESSIIFMKEYFSLARPDEPVEKLIEKTLRYAIYREEARKMRGDSFSPAAYLKFLWKHRAVALIKLR